MMESRYVYFKLYNLATIYISFSELSSKYKLRIHYFKGITKEQKKEKQAIVTLFVGSWLQFFTL